MVRFLFSLCAALLLLTSPAAAKAAGKLRVRGHGASYPATVVTNGLQAVYDLQNTGTGPRTTPTKTFEANQAELTALGAIWGNNGGDFIAFHVTSPITISGWDFCTAGMVGRGIYFYGTADAQVIDTKVCSDIGVGQSSFGNTQPTSTTVVDFDYVDFDGATLYADHGGITGSYDLIHNQPLIFLRWDVSTFPAPPDFNVAFDHVYWRIGPLSPPPPPATPAHIEAVQSGSGTLTLTYSFVDLRPDAVATYTEAWTGVFSLTRGGYTNTFSHNIMIGQDAEQAARAPGTFNPTIAHANTAVVNMDYNLMELGAGYSLNLDGGVNRPTDLGNNLNYNTGAAITF